MKSLKDWQLHNEIAGTDPNWKALRTLWHGNQQMADSRLLRSLRVKVEQLKEDFAKANGFENWSRVPLAQIQGFAQQLSTTVLKLVLDDNAGSGRAVNASRLASMGQKQETEPSPLPQDEMQPPANWKG